MFFEAKMVKDATDVQKEYPDVREALVLGRRLDYFVPGMKEDEVSLLQDVVDLRNIKIWISVGDEVMHNTITAVVTKGGKLFVADQMIDP